MDRLPDELIALICEHCDHADQKTARLVSWRLHDASSPSVFEHFYLGLFEYGLTALSDLSKSSLAKHVKKLTLFSDIIPSWTKGSYEKAIDMRPDFSKWLQGRKSEIREGYEGVGITTRLYPGDPRREYEALKRHDLSQEELDAGWLHYSECVRQQARWCQWRHGRRFREAFAALSNLTEANVQCATPFSGRTNNWPVWKGLRNVIRVGPDDFVWRQDIAELDYAHLSGQAALCLLEALAYRASFPGVKQIKSLSVHSSHLEPYMDLLDDDPSGPKVFMAYSEEIDELMAFRDARHLTLLDGFRNLTSLRLHIPHATVSAHVSANGVGMADETMDFLRSARHLRKLDLRYGDDEMSPDDESDSQLEDLFDTDEVVFPDLQDLALATNVPAEKLLNFLANHKGSLRSLELRDMLIHNVDLAIEQIPRIIKLDHVYMECLWDDACRTEGEFDVNYLCTLSRGTDFDAAYEQAVKAYLLGHVQTMPQIERDGGLGDVREWWEWQNEYNDTVMGSDNESAQAG
jgi:hypothetical protein